MPVGGAKANEISGVLSSYHRFSQYRIMWVMVFFDLPVVTKKDTRNYRRFVDVLEKDGFNRFQYSIFIRHCPGMDNARVHIKRVKNHLPPKGHVCIMHLTDKQFSMMEIFRSTKKEPLPNVPQQLEMF